jgi:hypothetical protein
VREIAQRVETVSSQSIDSEGTARL